MLHQGVKVEAPRAEAPEGSVRGDGIDELLYAGDVHGVEKERLLLIELLRPGEESLPEVGAVLLTEVLPDA